MRVFSRSEICYPPPSPSPGAWSFENHVPASSGGGVAEIGNLCQPSRCFDFGGFGPNLCSTKVAPRVSQGHRAAPRSPQEDRHFQTFFLSPGCPKSRPSWGLDLWTPCPFGGLWAKSLFNKDCLQSFPGPPGRPKEPTRAPTFSQNFEKIANRAREPKLDFLI